MWEKTCLLLLIFFLGAAQKPFAQGKNIPNGFVKVLPQDINGSRSSSFRRIFRDLAWRSQPFRAVSYPSEISCRCQDQPAHSSERKDVHRTRGRVGVGRRRKVRSGAAAEVSRRYYLSFACRCAAFSSHRSAWSGCGDRDVRSHENGFRPARS